jgi:hypothetical protein
MRARLGVSEAFGINDHGQITAYGCNAIRCSALLLQPDTTVLSPVPEPETPGGHFGRLAVRLPPNSEVQAHESTSRELPSADGATQSESGRGATSQRLPLGRPRWSKDREQRRMPLSQSRRCVPRPIHAFAQCPGFGTSQAPVQSLRSSRSWACTMCRAVCTVLSRP